MLFVIAKHDLNDIRFNEGACLRGFGLTTPIHTFEKCQCCRQSEEKGGLASAREGGKALIFSASIFNSPEPYGVASSWQKNK